MKKNTKAAGFYFFESYHYCINLAAEEPRKIIYLIRKHKEAETMPEKRETLVRSFKSIRDSNLKR